MSHLHFIGGEKGGVGKSVAARLLAQYWIDRSEPFAALDGDLSHGVLLRHYRDYTQPVDLCAPDSADQILDRALGNERHVLVDLPAQSARALQAWVFGANVLEMARELGVGITLWQVSDGGFASVEQLEQAFETYGDRVRHVVIKNRGRSKDFSQFDTSEARKKLEALTGGLAELPELDATAMYKIDSAGLSFWAAVHSDCGLRPLEKQRVKLWLGQCYAELDRVTTAAVKPTVSSSEDAVQHTGV